MLLDLKYEIIYGPVQSRRLGRSLGVNILPPQQKVCTFDCLYCQYGLSGYKMKSEVEVSQHAFPAVSEVLHALDQALKHLSQPVKYITFSGNGEATLHPNFKEIVEGVRQIRDTFSPTSKTAILSNSTTVNDPIVRETLAKLDVRIMKLDAGTQRMFVHYNRPVGWVTLEDTVSGLVSMKDVTIQSLFTKGPEGNFTPDHLSAWIKQIKKIEPLFVQVYTLDRDSPTKTVTSMERGELLHIRTLLEKENISAQYY
jgi:wyosine [tRNA(Phe)-imidazoG37] synthetase (radical SAM superfamily)